MWKLVLIFLFWRRGEGGEEYELVDIVKGRRVRNEGRIRLRLSRYRSHRC